MPWVIAEPGIGGPRSYTEQLTTYLCDWPDCSNTAEHVLGSVMELAACVALCSEHAKQLGIRTLPGL
jgi:hypothetical protein